MRRLQGCSSTADGRATCQQLLTEFQQHLSQAAQAQQGVQCTTWQQERQRQQELQLQARLEALQGANRVIVRALKALSERQKELGARCQLAEEAGARLTAQLLLCSEQLQASERAKAAVQSHLEVLLRQENSLGRL